MPFKKGQSGNPRGRKVEQWRKEAKGVRVIELARQHTVPAVEALVKALRSESDGTRVAAAQALLDRGWGKPSQHVEMDVSGSVEHVVKEMAPAERIMDAQQLLARARALRPANVA